MLPITPENFKISDRATIVFPYHRALDGLEEARLKDKKYGSTLRGIAPVYSDKYQKKTIMMGELLYPEYLEKRLAAILEWKNLTIQNVYGAEPYKLDDMLAWCEEFGEKLAPYICNTTKYLYDARGGRQEHHVRGAAGRAARHRLRHLPLHVLFLLQRRLRAASAPGIPGSHVDRTVGIVKAYSTCVGEGPFTAEWFGEEAEKPCVKAGAEYGAVDRPSPPRRPDRHRCDPLRRARSRARPRLP